jgi:anti-repressor protein
MKIVINSVEVALTSKDGQVFATSLDVAKVFEKRHDNILRDIQALIEKDLLNFEKMFYDDKYGRKQKAYLMDRDGLSLLVMGFTGEKALKWKIDFLKAFNTMENMLKNNQNLFQIPQTYAGALLLAANQAKEIEDKNKLLEAQKPRIEFANRLQKTDGTISIQDFAKILCDKNIQIGQNRLFSLFRQMGFLMADNKPFQKYVDMGVFTLKEDTFKNPSTGDNIVYFQTRITVKGQEYLFNKITCVKTPTYTQVSIASTSLSLGGVI